MGKPPLRGLEGEGDVYFSGAIEEMCYAFFLAGYDHRKDTEEERPCTCYTLILTESKDEE